MLNAVNRPSRAKKTGAELPVTSSQGCFVAMCDFAPVICS